MQTKATFRECLIQNDSYTNYTKKNKISNYVTQGNRWKRGMLPKSLFFYKWQKLLSNTTCTSRHNKENHRFYEKN